MSAWADLGFPNIFGINPRDALNAVIDAINERYRATSVRGRGRGGPGPNLVISNIERLSPLISDSLDLRGFCLKIDYEIQNLIPLFIQSYDVIIPPINKEIVTPNELFQNGFGFPLYSNNDDFSNPYSIYKAIGEHRINPCEKLSNKFLSSWLLQQYKILNKLSIAALPVGGRGGQYMLEFSGNVYRRYLYIKDEVPSYEPWDDVGSGTFYPQAYIRRFNEPGYDYDSYALQEYNIGKVRLADDCDGNFNIKLVVIPSMEAGYGWLGTADSCNNIYYGRNHKWSYSSPMLQKWSPYIVNSRVESGNKNWHYISWENALDKSIPARGNYEHKMGVMHITPNRSPDTTCAIDCSEFFQYYDPPN